MTRSLPIFNGKCIERESIEAQVAFKGTVELIVGNIITKEDQLGQGAIVWALKRLLPPLQLITQKPTAIAKATEQPPEEEPFTEGGSSIFGDRAVWEARCGQRRDAG